MNLFKKRLVRPLAFLITVSMLVSCSKDGGNGPSLDCNTVTNKAFAANILPIVQNSCSISSCHATGSANGPGALTNYSQVSAAASRIRTAVANGTMPQGGSLTLAQKNSILCWIDSGFPNN